MGFGGDSFRNGLDSVGGGGFNCHPYPNLRSKPELQMYMYAWFSIKITSMLIGKTTELVSEKF